MLEAGMQNTCQTQVTKNNTAKALSSGTLEVFATPAMIALMEETAYTCVADQLEDGAGTVGTGIDIKHVSATPIGMTVTCKAELIKVDGRALTFKVEAYDETGLIGEGIHERFIVYNEKFQAKANAKLK